MINDRTDLGSQLIRGGFGEVYVFGRPFAKVKSYRAAEARAKAAKQGSWGACSGGKAPPPTEEPEPVPKPACSDGADNDGDRSTDYPFDPGCADAADDSEKRDDYACDDGVDQDRDGTIDFPADTDCFSVFDPSEGSATPPPSGGCHSSYPTVCIPPAPPDLDCGQISHRNFTVRHDVADPDPHRFDGDKDGVGCEG